MRDALRPSGIEVREMVVIYAEELKETGKQDAEKEGD
jgi:hypothetical protein